MEGTRIVAGNLVAEVIVEQANGMQEYHIVKGEKEFMGCKVYTIKGWPSNKVIMWNEKSDSSCILHLKEEEQNG